MSVKHYGTSLGRQKSGVKRIIGKVNRGDREVWRVASDGRIKNLVTSASSTSAMDQAIVIYGRALKRLADR